MNTETAVTVGEVARLAGVSVRTLHHYDEIGIVSPQQRTDTGYRLYRRDDIVRLQEVLFFRELGFSLNDIKTIMARPEYERQRALIDQRALLMAKAARLFEMIDAVDRAIEADRMGFDMDYESMLDVFGDFDPSEYEAEAQERWGDTDAYREAARRTSCYTERDWTLMRQEGDAINTAFLALIAKGVSADSVEAMDLAEAHRGHLSKWFYDCTPEIHAGLGRTYITDQRFRTNIDKAGEGLAEFLSAAIAANHQRA